MEDKDKNRVRVQVVEESMDNKSEEKKEDDHHDDHDNEHKHEEHNDDKEHENHKEHENDNHYEEKKDFSKNSRKSYETQNKIPFWILFFAFLIGLTLGAGLIGGVFYYRSKVGKLAINVTKEKSSPQATVESSPTPQSEEKLDLSKYSIQILNGSGIAGEAGRVEKLLNTVGFTNTKTGNAKTYDFEESEIAIKKSDPEILFSEVEKALSSYKLTKIDPLDESSSFDIVITVGKSKN